MMFLPLGVLQQQIAGTSSHWSHAWTGAGGTTNNRYRFGFEFLVGSTDIGVNTLSFYAYGAGTENVRIHRESDGALMAEANINGSAGEWIDSTIAEVTLVATAKYVISYRQLDDSNRTIYKNQTGVTYDPQITKTDDAFGNDNDMPTYPTYGDEFLSARFGWQA